jgi:hypothetical protein
MNLPERRKQIRERSSNIFVENDIKCNFRGVEYLVDCGIADLGNWLICEIAFEV